MEGNMEGSMDGNAELYERLRILEDGGLITGAVTASCKRVIDLVLEEKPDVDGERFGMFVTHLAMAMQRIRNGEKEMPMDSQVLASVKMDPVYPAAESFSKTMFAVCDVEFTRTEQDFLTVHLCNLFT